MSTSIRAQDRPDTRHQYRYQCIPINLHSVEKQVAVGWCSDDVIVLDKPEVSVAPVPSTKMVIAKKLSLRQTQVYDTYSFHSATQSS